jgi:N-acetylglucosaminyl-diphospho-decaprenol L-rhamnosyltransferase
MINKEITILIILYEEKYEIIEECLDKIKDFKIIIIDNSNDKYLKKKIVLKHNIYKYFLNKKNIGFPKAANQGILECDTEYLLLLGADCLISYEDINQLLIAKKKYTNCFMTSPTFLNYRGEHTYNGGPFYEDGLKNEPIKNEGDICTNSILTSTVLFKVDDIKKIGMFDENYFLFFLDDDLCKRIKNLKQSVIQVFNSRPIHQSGQLKIRNPLKKIFFRNYYYDFEELYYYFKFDINNKRYFDIKKKVPKFIFKMILNFIILRPTKFIYYLSKTLAFYKFKRFIK